MAPVTTRAVLLRGHDYGETSRILRFYTLDHGLVGVMARGIRGRSGKGGATLSTFASGDLTAYLKPHRDLHTMKGFDCERLRSALAGDLLRFAGASAVGEVVVSHTEQESHPELFRSLESALDHLETAPADALPTACLAGLWGIVHTMGFSPELEYCVRCGTALGVEEIGRFDLAAGGMRCVACGADTAGPRIGGGARAQIARLLEGNLEEPISHPRRHLSLLSDFLAYHVASRRIRSLQFLADLLPAEERVG